MIHDTHDADMYWCYIVGSVAVIGNAEQGQLGRVSAHFSVRGGRRGLGGLLFEHQLGTVTDEDNIAIL
jgi:hypothetical protein